MAKKVYRVKGEIRSDDIFNIIDIVGNVLHLSNGKFCIDAPFRDKKLLKRVFSNEEAQKACKSFGKNRIVIFSSQNKEEARQIYAEISRFLIKDSSDEEVKN